MAQHSRFSPYRFVAVTLLVLLSVSPVDAQGLDNAAMLDQQRRNRLEEYRSSQNLVRNMQRLNVSRIEEVFSLKLENNTLAIELPLQQAAARRTGQFRVDVAGFSGPTYIQLSNQPIFERGPRGADGPVLENQRTYLSFTLISYEMPNPNLLSRLSVQSQQSYFHIERNTQLDGGHSMVRLMEQRGAEVQDGGGIHLWVNHFGGTAEQPVNINIQADDFATLVRDHPGETEKYIRPLLQQLGQEQVFAPEANIAWQVLADYWPVNEQVRQQVLAVLPGLDHADFREREKTLDQLLKLGREGAAAMRRLDRSGFSAERNLMIDRAMAPYARLPERETRRLMADRRFLIDCLYSSDELIRASAFKQLKKLVAREDLKFNASAPAAERHIAVRDLRDLLGTKSATQPAGAVPASR